MNIETRSALVFAASVHIPGRYELCQVTAKAARKLHKRNDRMQDTVDDVLTMLDGKSAIRGSSQAHTPLPADLGTEFAPSLNRIRDAAPVVTSQLALVPEERNFSHV